jgi:hypothetical protein
MPPPRDLQFNDSPRDCIFLRNGQVMSERNRLCAPSEAHCALTTDAIASEARGEALT